MARVNKSNKKHLWVLIIIGIAVIVALFWIVINSTSMRASKSVALTPTIALTSIQSKEYHSKDGKISFIIPAGFELKDDGLSLSLFSSQGTIDFHAQGTNASSVDSYLAEADMRSTVEHVSNRTHVVINNLGAVAQISNTPGRHDLTYKAYFIYNQYVVYIFSTTSPTLYAVLDQVAQSFRYTP